jgi:hypothetical protein
MALPAVPTGALSRGAGTGDGTGRDRTGACVGDGTRRGRTGFAFSFFLGS